MPIERIENRVPPDKHKRGMIEWSRESHVGAGLTSGRLETGKRRTLYNWNINVLHRLQSTNVLNHPKQFLKNYTKFIFQSDSVAAYINLHTKVENVWIYSYLTAPVYFFWPSIWPCLQTYGSPLHVGATNESNICIETRGIFRFWSFSFGIRSADGSK